MSDLTKSSKKLVREVYTYTFDENLTTTLSIGANAGVSNLIFNLYDKNTTDVGYIMYTDNYRTLSTKNIANVQVGFFLNNNNDLISFNYNEINTNTKAPDNTEISVKATYSSGKYKNKDVNVNIKFLKDSKRKVIITYKE
jgi:hypothetical protein